MIIYYHLSLLSFNLLSEILLESNFSDKIHQNLSVFYRRKFSIIHFSGEFV